MHSAGVKKRKKEKAGAWQQGLRREAAEQTPFRGISDRLTVVGAGLCVCGGGGGITSQLSAWERERERERDREGGQRETGKVSPLYE